MCWSRRSTGVCRDRRSRSSGARSCSQRGRASGRPGRRPPRVDRAGPGLGDHGAGAVHRVDDEGAVAQPMGEISGGSASPTCRRSCARAAVHRRADPDRRGWIISDMFDLARRERSRARRLRLSDPRVTFWTLQQGDEILGCVALNQLGPEQGTNRRASSIRSRPRPPAARSRPRRGAPPRLRGCSQPADPWGPGRSRTRPSGSRRGCGSRSLAIAEKCANTSALPSSGVMKPNPFSALNHLTVPVAMMWLAATVADSLGPPPASPTGARRVDGGRAADCTWLWWARGCRAAVTRRHRKLRDAARWIRRVRRDVIAHRYLAVTRVFGTRADIRSDFTPTG